MRAVSGPGEWQPDRAVPRHASPSPADLGATGELPVGPDSGSHPRAYGDLEIDQPRAPFPDNGEPSRGRSGNARGRHAKKPERNERAALLKELPLLVGIALVLALLIKTFLVQAFYIPSDSMENTLKVGDRVLVNKLGQHFGDVSRGEVVVFRDPGGWLASSDDGSSGNVLLRSAKNVLVWVGLLPSDSEQDLIKRVVGVPGDVVACCDEQGRVTVNGVPLDEPYIYPGNAPSDSSFTVEVPEGRLFMMGDHRSVSADSRVHLSEPGQGTIPEDDVIGRAFVKVWPPSRIGGLPVPDAFAAVAASAVASPLLLGFALALPLFRLKRPAFRLKGPLKR